MHLLSMWSRNVPKWLFGLVVSVIVLGEMMIFGCNGVISIIRKSPNGIYTSTSGQTLLGIATSTIDFEGNTLRAISNNSLIGQKRWDYKYDFISQDEVITEWNIEKYQTKTEEQIIILQGKLEKAVSQSVKDSIRSQISDFETQRQANLQKMRTMLRKLEFPIKPERVAYILLYSTSAENATLIGLNNIITEEIEIHNFKYMKEQDIVIIDEVSFYK